MHLLKVHFLITSLLVLTFEILVLTQKLENIKNVVILQPPDVETYLRCQNVCLF